MKKLMTAALGLSLLSGTAVFAAQNTSSDSTMKTTKKSKHKKSKKTASTTSTTSK